MHLYLARCVEWASPVLPDNRLLPPPPLRRRGKVTTVFCSFGSITFFRKALYIYTNAERKERKKKTLSASTVLNVERQLGSRWLLSQSKIKKGFDLLFFWRRPALNLPPLTQRHISENRRRGKRRVDENVFRHDAIRIAAGKRERDSLNQIDFLKVPSLFFSSSNNLWARVLESLCRMGRAPLNNANAVDIASRLTSSDRKSMWRMRESQSSVIETSGP